MPPPLTIAVAAEEPPRSSRSWSGISSSIVTNLEKAGVNVIDIPISDYKERFWYSAERSFHWRMRRKWFHAGVEPYVLRQHARRINEFLDKNRCDAVLSIQPEPIAYLQTTTPTIMVHDSTYERLRGYYFSSYRPRTDRLRNKACGLAIERATHCVFSSDWAAQSAIAHYGARPDRVNVIEFGANLVRIPGPSEVDEMIERRTRATEIRFLLLGVDWLRKGGDDAVKLVRELRRRDLPALLDVVGCELPEDVRRFPFCQSYGFLRKDDPAELGRLAQMFESAHFLLVPSHAEAYGCVFCEANAYGVPAVGRNVGGIPQIIREGVNGLLLSADGDNMNDLADKLTDLWSEPEKYRQMAALSRREYESRLNWSTFSQKLLALLSN